MRVRLVYATAGNTIDPCATEAYGETEDYTITVAPGPLCATPYFGVATNVSSTSASLDWTNGCLETMWDVHVMPSTANFAASLLANGNVPNNANVNAHPYVVSALNPSLDYVYYVRAKCGPTTYSTWAGPFGVPPSNDDICGAKNLTVTDVPVYLNANNYL
jgi:hypothetical protein